MPELNDITLIVALFAICIDIIGALYLVKITRKSPDWITEIVDKFKDGSIMDGLVSQSEDGELTIREDVSKVIDAFGSRVAQSLKMSFLQGLGANAKIESGLKGAIAEDVIDNQMPILNLVGDFAGINVKKYISKHPDAVGQLLGMIPPQYIAMLKGNFTKNNGGGQPQNTSGGNLGW
ncbi:hypothetical protein KAR91_58570 [Candidatus Pacearchaeota archaeon]|nr:hypothetical protein [Candidatus Pacearchaeota archaeon]